MAGSVRFNKEFYSPESVTAAVEDWAEVGAFAVTDGEGHLLVELSSLAEGDVEGDDGAVVLGEFTNYVLGLEVGNRR